MSYLHKEQLQELIGAKHRRKIIPWLKENGIPFVFDAYGWPIVAESVLQAKLGQSIKREPRINFA